MRTEDVGLVGVRFCWEGAQCPDIFECAHPPVVICCSCSASRRFGHSTDAIIKHCVNLQVSRRVSDLVSMHAPRWHLLALPRCMQATKPYAY